MNPGKEYLKQTYSYLALRKAVGWIGITLPFILRSGIALFCKEEDIPKTISLYYHSCMRDVFVGAMCAIALFLFFYKGYEKKDNIAANLAAICALGIAFFPTCESKPYDQSAIIHLISAALFFLVLSFFSISLFTQRGPDPTNRKLIRNRIYKICGIIMIACMLIIMIFLLYGEERFPDSMFIYYAETIALTAFGISWLTKGGQICSDLKPVSDSFDKT
ncbi:MAG: DUF998 domain-containing protein [Bacteroidetes bacterium]|jgi:hypothetical protein|nr:DUF998 domain-containing protein [Bacteroidota bacterium]